jgi:hypothetical protein
MAQNPSPITPQEARETHRSETLRYVVAPVAAGGIGLILLLLIAAFVPTFAGRSLMADVLVMLCLCPAALCLFPIGPLLVAAVFMMNPLHDKTGNVLIRLVDLSHKLNLRVDKSSDRIARRAIDFGAKIAPVEEKIFGIFDKRK